MTIEAHCECGQSILAKDEYAGRRVKCSKCGDVLRLPNLSEVVEKELLPEHPNTRPDRPVPQAPPVLEQPAPLPKEEPPTAPLITPEPREEPPAPVNPSPGVETMRMPADDIDIPDISTLTRSPSPPKAPQQSNGYVSFTCLCGRQYQALREHGGEPTKCPHCGDILFIPLTST